MYRRCSAAARSGKCCLGQVTHVPCPAASSLEQYGLSDPTPPRSPPAEDAVAVPSSPVLATKRQQKLVMHQSHFFLHAPVKCGENQETLVIISGEKAQSPPQSVFPLMEPGLYCSPYLEGSEAQTEMGDGYQCQGDQNQSQKSPAPTFITQGCPSSP